LAATVKWLLERLEEDQLSKVIQSNVYVDNVLVGFESPTEFQILYRKIKEMFQNASMNMREFMTSATRQMVMIPEEDKLTESKAKLLGLKWNVQEDTLTISLPTTDLVNLVTKRKAIACISTPFDPLGVISPAILPA
jgi:hypothetical protein